MSPYRSFKVAVLGSTGVGKTSVIEKMIDGTFIEGGTYPTIEDQYEHNFEVDLGTTSGDPTKVVLHILDTAGKEPQNGLRKSYIRRSHGFLLVYSVISEESFRFIRELRKEIEDLKMKDTTPIYVIGTMADLSAQRAVDISDAQTWAALHNFGFCEMSLKDDNANLVKTPFEELLQRILVAEDGSGKHRRAKSADKFMSHMRQGSNKTTIPRTNNSTTSPNTSGNITRINEK